MNQIIKKIYPVSKKPICSADSLYLKPVLSRIKSPKGPIYYANFLTSLDGRIATYSRKHASLLTPKSIKSDIDFSLFCQLHAQADCLVTNTKYIQGLEKGYYGNILSIKDPNLNKWRQKNNIKEQKIIILSNSLNFKKNKYLEIYKKRITILTTSKNQKKINSFNENGYKIIKCSGKNISPNYLNKYIIKNKYKSIYFIAGPIIVEQMISNNLLNRLYCSTSISMIGTKNYDTIIRGNFLSKPTKLELKEMYIYNNESKKIKEQTLFQIFNLKGK